MKKLTFLLVGLFSIAIMVSACKDSKKQEEKSEMHEHEHESHEGAEITGNAVFQCPMDCEKGKTYEEKGNCPVCKMDLKSKEGLQDEDDESHDASDHSDEEEYEEELDDHEEADGHDKDK